jgi:hypothetical protein
MQGMQKHATANLVADILRRHGLPNAKIQINKDPPCYIGTYKRHLLGFAYKRHDARILNDALTEWLRHFSYPTGDAHALFNAMYREIFHAHQAPFNLNADLAHALASDTEPPAQITAELTPGDALLVAHWLTLNHHQQPSRRYIAYIEANRTKLAGLVGIVRRLHDVAGLQNSTESIHRLDIQHEHIGGGLCVLCESVIYNKAPLSFVRPIMAAICDALPSNDIIAGHYAIRPLDPAHARAWLRRMGDITGDAP